MNVCAPESMQPLQVWIGIPRERKNHKTAESKYGEMSKEENTKQKRGKSVTNIPIKHISRNKSQISEIFMLPPEGCSFLHLIVSPHRKRAEKKKTFEGKNQSRI